MLHTVCTQQSREGISSQRQNIGLGWNNEKNGKEMMGDDHTYIKIKMFWIKKCIFSFAFPQTGKNKIICMKSGRITYCSLLSLCSESWCLFYLSFFICWFVLRILESILSALFSRASMESSWLSISDWRPRPRLFSLVKPSHISSGWLKKKTFWL